MRTLQAAYPDTPITWVIGTTEHKLVGGVTGVEFITFDKSRGWRGLLDVRRQLAGRQFHVLLNLHASLRANLVSLCIDAQRRIGYDRARARDFQWLFTTERVPPAQQQHVGDAMLSFALALGAPEAVIDWSLPIEPAAQAWVAAQLPSAQRICVISPCSSQRARNYRDWSRANYAAIVRHLVEGYAATVVLSGGATPLEQDYAAALREAGGAQVIDLVGKTTLQQWAALLDAADLVICPDSGPVHVATALGTPVIGLYATSNPGRTGPYRDPLGLTVNRYPEAVQAAFGKPVDAVRWGQRVRDPAALELITVADVTARIARAWGEPGAGG